MGYTAAETMQGVMGGGGGSPVRVGAVLGNDHLQLAQPAHGRSVGASGELQEEALLLLTERVQSLPELPAVQSQGKHLLWGQHHHDIIKHFLT